VGQLQMPPIGSGLARGGIDLHGGG
jgi:hypothetical protein